MTPASALQVPHAGQRGGEQTPESTHAVEGESAGLGGGRRVEGEGEDVPKVTCRILACPLGREGASVGPDLGGKSRLFFKAFFRDPGDFKGSWAMWT